MGERAVKRTAFVTVTAALVAAALGTGYWWGSRNQPLQIVNASNDSAAPKPERKVLYYRHPMGLPDTSPVPKKDEMGMDYIPVYEDEVNPPPAKSEGKGKILYYRHPMGLPDTSPVPKKDEMGMDYIPVYESDVAPANMVRISLDKVQKLGVRTEPVVERRVARVVRAVGVIEPNERRIYTVSPKFEGWIERLYVNATGEPVRRGQPLMDVYSPGLVATQQEYLIAWKGLQSLRDASPEVQARMQDLVEGALQRLSYWDISPQELERLQREGKASRTLTLRSQVSGVVLEKMAFEGMRFMPGEVLYKIADLSTVWLLAEIFEQDLPLVRVGQQVAITLPAFPGRTFTGRVIFVYPTLTPGTRTGKVRIEIPNPDGALKPAMYASLELVDAPRKTALTVPDSAVLDSGIRQVVIVQRGEGLFEPREVKLGMRGEGYFEVLEGVTAGERVVVAANFLIDAESNLKAALGAFGGHGHGGAAPAPGGQGTPQTQPAAAEAKPEAAGAQPGSAEHKGH